MKAASKRNAARNPTPRRPPIKLIDGARHWPRTLDQFVWLLLRAGVSADQITQSVGVSLGQRRSTRALKMPLPEVLEYSRVLTQWQNDPAYLDDYGAARSLKLSGQPPSFTSLVRQALPSADAGTVRGVLVRRVYPTTLSAATLPVAPDNAEHAYAAGRTADEKSRAKVAEALVTAAAGQ